MTTTHVNRACFEFTYTPLEDLSTTKCSQVHIFGVVKSCRCANQTTRGTSYYTTVVLHNKALYTQRCQFSVSIFSNTVSDLPTCQVGDILRLNYVMVDKFRNTTNGKMQMHGRGQWVLFSLESRTLKCNASSPPLSQDLTAEEQNMIVDLRNWRDVMYGECVAVVSTRGNQCPPIRIDDCTSLSQMKLGRYMHLKGLVVDKDVLTLSTVNVCSVKIMDGTLPNLECEPQNLVLNNSFNQLLPAKYAVSIVAYGPQATAVSQCELGSYYLFANVHCSVHKFSGKPKLYLHQENELLPTRLSDEQSLDTEEVIVTELCTLHADSCSAHRASRKHESLYVLVQKANRIQICFAPPILNTEEAVICNLDTTILVSDLEEVSMSRLHKLHQCKAHMENPVLFKVTCNILPSFVCEEIPLEQGRDHGIGRRSLRVTLQDEQNRENILTASVLPEDLQQLCLRRNKKEKHLSCLSHFLPVCQVTEQVTQVTYMNRATLAVQLFKGTLYICHTRLNKV